MELPSQYFIFKLTLLLVLSCNVGAPLAENFSGYISCTKNFTDLNLGSSEFPHYFISFHLSNFFLYHERLQLREGKCHFMDVAEKPYTRFYEHNYPSNPTTNFILNSALIEL